MSDTPRRRLLDRMAGTPSLLAAGSRLVGDIETPGALIASGHVQGDGRVEGELALSAVIAGAISGAILVTEKIEIAATAVIRGRVSARRIALARGATVEGEITVTSGEPIVQFDEKRGRGSS